MRIAVRYMAQAKQATGVAVEDLELLGPCLPRDLLGWLAERHGEPLRRLLCAADGKPAVLLFVGDEQVDPADPVLIEEGDVVTVLSPMSGGSPSS
jgi:molybdopterin converting factor small subunit